MEKKQNQQPSKKSDQKNNSIESENLFHLNRLYPNIKDVFKAKIKPLDEIKNSCLIVLDTNVLLLPYTVGSKGLGEVNKIYSKLISESRLQIPGQVVREFLKNRPTKLTELYQQISNKKSKIQKLELQKYPLLESVDLYQKLLEKQDEINKLLYEFQKEANKFLKYIGKLTWDDNVSKLYSELFDEKVITEIDFDEDEFIKELEYRYEHNMPPGFKDKSKPDKGIGDLIIWKTILYLGQKYNSDLIFVTGDEKNDWYHKSMDTPLYARYELVNEYRDLSKGRTLHLISLSELLDLLGADQEIVREIQSVEAEQYKEIKDAVIKKITYPTKIRRSIPNLIKMQLITNAQGRCQICSIEYPYLEIAMKDMDLNNEENYSLNNLMALCPNCHREFDKKKKSFSI
ncbi:PIN domain-containing protein [Lysinibacillus sphaericus]|uniref:PIN domain-containing protein n=1 Tax=Lysinibacillus sphaericus TaxID=1421 RepID=UPI0021630850|nr:PIN domain-containing protein [Lysinibacillus sphaericus]MCS1384077.1 PIN domain-containing protein [Lysinibacillus sphaericus]